MASTGTIRVKSCAARHSAWCPTQTSSESRSGPSRACTWAAPRCRRSDPNAANYAFPCNMVDAIEVPNAFQMRNMSFLQTASSASPVTLPSSRFEGRRLWPGWRGGGSGLEVDDACVCLFGLELGLALLFAQAWKHGGGHFDDASGRALRCALGRWRAVCRRLLDEASTAGAAAPGRSGFADKALTACARLTGVTGRCRLLTNGSSRVSRRRARHSARWESCGAPGTDAPAARSGPLMERKLRGSASAALSRARTEPRTDCSRRIDAAARRREDRARRWGSRLAAT